MKQPVFSIITVTWNAAGVIEKTIQSVLSQTDATIEYIIIDGGSTDGTIDIIRSYEARISYWISETDKGLYDAMNKGLALATGDYVWFLNAGDTLYSPGTVSHLSSLFIESIGKHKPDIFYGETMMVNKQGESLGMRRLKAPDKLSWKSFRMGMLVCHQSFVISRHIAPEYNLDYTFSADFDWCIRCMKHAKEICNTGTILANYLDEGITTQNRKASLMERFRIMCNYYGKIQTALLHNWFAIRFAFAKFVRKKV